MALWLTRTSPALALAVLLAACSGGREINTPPIGPDSGVPEELCGPLHPLGRCAVGFRCYGGSCFENGEFCSATNPTGLCQPSESCENGTCVPRNGACSPSNPTGLCDQGLTCRAGQCTDNTLLCSMTNPTGLCVDAAESCVDGTCHAPAQLCSMTNLTGICPSPLTCRAGTCATANPCAPNEPLGFCEMGKTCIEGACTENADLCSATNPTGICVSGRSCIDGSCIDDALLCSPATPTGVCGSSNTCFEGACVDPATLCSTTNQNGLCPRGETCNLGVCEVVGNCAACAANETCLEGECRDDMLLCSPMNPTGLCETGFNCIAGTCIDAGIGCSQTNQSGVCGPGEICNAGVCEPIDDATLCNDSNPCTRDWFDYSRNRCSHADQAAACSDGNACTNDTCVQGACSGTRIAGCIEPPTINPYVTPTNVAVLNLSGTKPSGSSIEINNLEAVSQNPDTTWAVVLNLVPGENVYVIRSLDQAQASATIEVRVVYDITPPITSLTPGGGVFLNGVTVRVATNEAATVYYSTDGATPDATSPSFQSVKEFRVFDATRLRFRAIDQAQNWETNVVAADYEITAHGNGWDSGPMLAERLIHAGVAARANSVYVVGGSDGLAPQAGAYAYDHSDQSWTTLPSMPSGRAQLALVPHADVIYAIGGENNGVPLNTVEAMDLSLMSLSWETLAPMPSTRFGVATAVHGRNIHVFGGKTNGNAVLTNHEVFDTSTRMWTNQVAQMPRARYAFGAVIHASLIYLVGGETANGTPIAEVDVYNPATDVWTTVASLPTPRSFAAISLLKNEGVVSGGHTGIIVAGGRAAAATSTPIVEEYIIEDDAWRERTPMDEPRHSGTAVTVLKAGSVDSIDPEVWVVGGQLPSGLSDTIISFSFSQDYVRHVREMPEARFMHAAAPLNSRIYLFGGRNFTEELDAWEYDPETDTYRMLPPLATFQSGLSAAAAGDYVYAIGGADNFGNSVPTVRAYDRVQDMWIDRFPMQAARRDAAVAVLGNDIWVIGGWNNGALQTVEVYDITTDMWRAATALPEGRTGAMAIAHDGEIYVLGGVGPNGSENSSLIKLDGMTWTQVLPSGFAVSHGSAVLSGDDQLTVFAGRAAGTPINAVRSVSLATNIVEPPIGTSNIVAAYDHSAAAYLHGKLYLFGGNSTAMIGPSGEVTVQKIEGRCFNGVLDGREVAGLNGHDSGGGCPLLGFEHSTGLGELFFNEFPVSTTSLQRALDACNAHYNTTTCSQPCSSGCPLVNQTGACQWDTGYRWRFGSGNCFGSHGAGAVEEQSSAAGLAGNWY